MLTQKNRSNSFRGKINLTNTINVNYINKNKPNLDVTIR